MEFKTLNKNEMLNINGGAAFMAITTGPIIFGSVIAKYILKKWFK